MKPTYLVLIALSLSLLSSVSLACNFCSSKPKGLASDGPAQDPGSASISTSSGGKVVAPGQGASGRGSGNAFTYDLKNYKADGQRSNNEKWSSGDFFDNR